MHNRRTRAPVCSRAPADDVTRVRSPMEGEAATEVAPDRKHAKIRAGPQPTWARRKAPRPPPPCTASEGGNLEQVSNLEQNLPRFASCLPDSAPGASELTEATRPRNMLSFSRVYPAALATLATDGNRTETLRGSEAPPSRVLLTFRGRAANYSPPTLPVVWRSSRPLSLCAPIRGASPWPTLPSM